MEEKLKEARKKAGLTQQQLADKVGCKQRDICRWEKGIHEPRASMLKKIAEALGCNVSDLV